MVKRLAIAAAKSLQLCPTLCDPIKRLEFEINSLNQNYSLLAYQ